MDVNHENKNPDSPLDLDAAGEPGSEMQEERSAAPIREFAPMTNSLDTPIKVGG